VPRYHSGPSMCVNILFVASDGETRLALVGPSGLSSDFGLGVKGHPVFFPLHIIGFLPPTLCIPPSPQFPPFFSAKYSFPSQKCCVLLVSLVA